MLLIHSSHIFLKTDTFCVMLGTVTVFTEGIIQALHHHRLTQ